PALVGTEKLRQPQVVDRRRLQALAPRLKLGRQFELKALVVEQREQQVGRYILGTDTGGRIAPLVQRRHARRFQRDQPDIRDDDRAAVGRLQRLEFVRPEQLLAGAKDPLEID